MKDEFSEELTELGRRIKDRREELGLSLRDLGSLADMSPAFLSELERGKANPTLASVRKVVNALELPMYRLVEDGSQSSPVVQRGERVALELPSRHFRIELLTPRLDGTMILFEQVAGPETGNLIAQPLADPSEECIVVLEGKLMVRVAGSAYHLEEGDSIYFEHRHLEAIRVVGDGECRYIAAVSRACPAC